MNICPKCDYKVISNAMFEKHIKTHEIDVEPVEAVKVEEVPEVRGEDPVKPVTDEITLHFRKPVEVYINGKAYLGQDIVVPNMSIAAEIVRITREAYGPAMLV